MHNLDNLENRYKVVPRVLVFVFKKNEVLLIHRNASADSFAGKYNGVGGHVEHEEDVYQAAQRELNEETGLQNIPLALCGCIISDAEPGVGIGLFIFAGKYKSGKIVSSAEGIVEWVKLGDVTCKPVVSDLPILLEQTKKSMKTGKTFFGKSWSDDKGELRIAINNQDLA